jgi:hypothetical protein
MSIVKLQKRPVLSDYKLRPVEAPESTTLTLDPEATTGAQPTPRNQFPLSALLDASPMPPPSTRATTGRRSSLATNLASLLEDSDGGGDDPSEMDWTPTQNTHTTFAPRAVPSVFSDASSAPPTPSPMFAWDRAGAPSQRGGAPKPPPAPSAPARALAAARGIPAAEDRTEAQESPREMRMGAPRLELRGQETGLEGIFNSVFSLSDEPAGMGRRGGEGAGLGIDGDAGDVVMEELAPAAKAGWVGAGTWTLVVAAVFGLLVAWFMGSETARRRLADMEVLEKLLRSMLRLS